MLKRNMTTRQILINLINQNNREQPQFVPYTEDFLFRELRPSVVEGYNTQIDIARPTDGEALNWRTFFFNRIPLQALTLTDNLELTYKESYKSLSDTLGDINEKYGTNLQHTDIEDRMFEWEEDEQSLQVPFVIHKSCFVLTGCCGLTLTK